MKFWSRFWKASKKPKKQRKYIYHAPLHIRHKLVSVTLSKELRKKYNKRAIPLRKGDEVEILTGDFKKKKGKVRKVDLKKLKVYIDGIVRKKVDGTEVQVPFHPSNLKIINLNLEDEKRLKSLKKKEKENVASKETKNTKILESKKERKKMGSKSKTRSS
ncbi:MAG: 50S ribosomal protein L24 [Candidatus Aenigmarchaeota archaeon]|nr:50S ribosomal protein L24 [Candidatus Aenigmarchaeota archaeon]